MPSPEATIPEYLLRTYEARCAECPATFRLQIPVQSEDDPEQESFTAARKGFLSNGWNEEKGSFLCPQCSSAAANFRRDQARRADRFQNLSPAQRRAVAETGGAEVGPNPSAEDEERLEIRLQIATRRQNYAEATRLLPRLFAGCYRELERFPQGPRREDILVWARRWVADEYPSLGQTHRNNIAYCLREACLEMRKAYVGETNYISTSELPPEYEMHFFNASALAGRRPALHFPVAAELRDFQNAANS